MKRIDQFLSILFLSGTFLYGFFLRYRKRQKKYPLLNTSSKEMLVCLRIHYGADGVLPNSQTLIHFLKTVTYANMVLICVEQGNYTETQTYIDNLQLLAKVERVITPFHVQQVTPWGSFIPALNAGVSFAVKEDYEFILFQSLEASMPTDGVTIMKHIIVQDESHLVVGAALPGHAFQSNHSRLSTVPTNLNPRIPNYEVQSVAVEIRGCTCPWNTLAIWRTRLLARTGFLLVGEGMKGIPAGIEEVSTISVLQRINPNLKAFLVQLPGVSWNTRFEDKKREEYHQRKMRSKDERAAVHLSELGIVGGIVVHLSLIS